MDISNTVAVFAVAFSLIVFLQLGLSAFRRVHDSKSYLFAGRGISGLHFQHTLVAGGTSLATVLVFFLTTGRLYGFLFLVNLATFILGQYLFFRLAEKSQADLQRFTTLSEWVRAKTGSSYLFWIIRLITISAFAGVLFVEVLLGVAIFDYFVAIPNSEFYGFFAISLLMLVYIALGGFTAVVESDSWQFKLISTAAGCLIVFLLLFYRPEGGWSAGEALLPSAGVFEMITLVLNATIVNLTLPLCQLSSWQRVSAAGNWVTVRKNFTKGLWKIAAVWLAFIAFSWGVAGGQEDLSSIMGLLDLLRSYGPVASFVLYPLIFVGLVSALLSTADSAVMAITLEAFYDEDSRGHSWRKQRLRYVLFSATILGLLGIGFWVFHGSASKYFVHLVFVLFSQVIVMFPLMWSLVNPSVRLSKRGQRVVAFGILAGFAAVWSVSVGGMLYSGLGWTQFSSAFGLVIAAAGVYIGRRV